VEDILLLNKFVSDCRYVPQLRRYSPTKLCDGAQMAIFMVALWNRADHYIFALWFLHSIFYLFLFPRLISAVADWISIILPHMVWP